MIDAELVVSLAVSIDDVVVIIAGVVVLGLVS